MVYKLFDLVKVGRKPPLNGHGPFCKRVLVQHIQKYNLKKIYFMIDCAKCQEIQTVKDYINRLLLSEIYHFYE